MQTEILKRLVGVPVIVQLREAYAVCTTESVARPAIALNEDGVPLMKDGTPVPEDIKGEDITPEKMQLRPVWDIAVATDPTMEARPVFQYAIGPAFIEIVKDQVRVNYRGGKDDAAMITLVVSPEDIAGVTYVANGPMPREESRIVAP